VGWESRPGGCVAPRGGTDVRDRELWKWAGGLWFPIGKERRVSGVGGRARVRCLRMLAVVAAFSLICVASASASGAAGERKLTIYAVVSSAQFMNHADDRIRGMSQNPFTPNEQALVIVDKGTEKGNGPFPGDDVLYRFKLYTSPSFGKSTTSALFTCYYDFFKRATCDAYFELGGGIVVASGQVAFGSSRFTLSVSGGTSRYLGARGEVVAAPAAKDAQRLDFALVG
jgi:hypothetical protein